MHFVKKRSRSWLSQGSSVSRGALLPCKQALRRICYLTIAPFTLQKKMGLDPKKLVRTRYFCRVNLPYHVCMKWIRTHFFLGSFFFFFFFSVLGPYPQFEFPVPEKKKTLIGRVTVKLSCSRTHCGNQTTQCFYENENDSGSEKLDARHRTRRSKRRIAVEFLLSILRQVSSTGQSTGHHAADK